MNIDRFVLDWNKSDVFFFHFIVYVDYYCNIF